MKRFVSLVLAAAACFSLLCLPVSADGLDLDESYYSRFRGKDISINVYNWGEYISDGSDDTLDVNAAFEEATGITVNYSTFATNEELYAKLKSGGADFDIVIPSDYMISRMIQEEMLLPLNLENIPALANIDPRYLNADYDPDGAYSVPYTWGTVGIIYNTTMVDEVVDSWEILWDEKYTNNVLMFSNPRDAFGITLKKLGYSLNTTDELELRVAAEELKIQKPIVQAYVMDEIFDKMQGGEAALAPYYAGDALTMMDVNPDLAFATPKEGTNIFYDAMCIPSSCQQKEAAEMYINFMCEAEVAAANIEYIGYSTPNAAAYALLDEETQTNPISYPDEELKENMEAYIALPEETNLLLDTLWTEILTTDDQFLTWMMPVLLVAGCVASVVKIAARKRRRAREMADY
ncbi:MAG: ABC transporter substrate-binding protein [Oscillospiraceae bacterium]|nr:ABC transporter substrate-binding protein [Oscillospiraceae bacterium]